MNVKKSLWTIIINITLVYNSICYSSPLPQQSNVIQDDKLIFQTESTIYPNSLYNSFGLTYYRDSWYIGIQIFNIHLVGKNIQTFEYDTYISLGKSFEILNDLNLDIISLNGTDNIFKQLHSTSSIDLTYNISDSVSIQSGLYYVNDALAAIHQPFNFHTGINYSDNTIHSSIDYFSGSNNLSGIVFNTSFKSLFKNVRPYIGIQASTPYNTSNIAGIFGITIKLSE